MCGYSDTAREESDRAKFTACGGFRAAMRSYSAHMSNSPLSGEAAGPQVDDLNSPLVVAVHEGYLKIGRSMMERSLTRANIVLTGATATTTATPLS
jgi:hypothetical protein